MYKKYITLPENYQGMAVMNFTEWEIPYIRMVEYKHFEFGKQAVTYVTKEYPQDWMPGQEAYYPVNNEKNQALYRQYSDLARQDKKVLIVGCLAGYVYYDMDKVVVSALMRVKDEFAE